ncbi:MAG: trypsin-like serine protease [Proteobacteria bacterium]|nr:trypsin-like serine protease [Pseudomonadota bacterium]
MNMRISVLTCIVTSIFGWSACKSKENFGQLENIYGDDSRKTLSKMPPFGSVGRLSNGCTMFMVGPRIALTAAHCAAIEVNTLTVELHADEKGTRMNMQVLERGINLQERKILNQEYDGNISENDWAILLMTDGFSNSCFDVSSALSEGEQLVVAGYSADFISRHGGLPGVSKGCTAHIANNWIEHSCDVTGGGSGGPVSVFRGEKYVAVGLNSFSARVGSKINYDRPDKNTYEIATRISPRVVEKINRYNLKYNGYSSPECNK